LALRESIDLINEKIFFGLDSASFAVFWPKLLDYCTYRNKYITDVRINEIFAISRTNLFGDLAVTRIRDHGKVIHTFFHKPQEYRHCAGADWQSSIEMNWTQLAAKIFSQTKPNKIFLHLLGFGSVQHK
jgi:hypothetical protein